MLHYLLALLVVVSILTAAMEKQEANRSKIAIVKQMAHAKKDKYNRAICCIDELNVDNLYDWERVLLKKLATRSHYTAMLSYAFGVKYGGLHASWPIARDMLIEAVNANAESNVRMLIQEGVGVNFAGQKIVPYDPNQPRLTPLIVAIRNTNCSIVYLLLDNGADSNHACPNAYLPLMEALIQYKICDDELKRSNKSPLERYESIHSCKNIIDQLLEKKADPCALDTSEFIIPNPDAANAPYKCKSALQMAQAWGLNLFEANRPSDSNP